MGTRDPRVDAYVARSAPFAQPILVHIRELVHEVCPEVEETMKWSFPHFTYRGKILCSMASFKQHCALGFWKGSEVVGGAGADPGEAMGQFGRITAPDDLPPREELAGYVRRAMELIASGGGGGAPSPKRAPKPPLAVPDSLTEALAGNEKARAAFEAFSPSHRREYVEWITEAKGEETRKRRIATALEWLAEGKSRNWKYEKPRPA